MSLFFTWMKTKKKIHIKEFGQNRNFYGILSLKRIRYVCHYDPLDQTHSHESSDRYSYLKIIHSANPKSREVGIIDFAHVVRPSPPFKISQNKTNKTGVNNDPLGQTHSHANSEHCFSVVFVFLDLKSGDGRTDKLCESSDHCWPLLYGRPRGSTK